MFDHTQWFELFAKATWQCDSLVDAVWLLFRVNKRATAPADWQLIMFVSWIIGMMLIVLNAVREHATLHCLSKNSARASDRVDNFVSEITPKNICKRVHQDVSKPLVIGAVNPTILVPDKLEVDLSGSQLIMALAHEVAPIKRRDGLIASYAFVCQNVFFINQAVWFAKREWLIARESACDQFATENPRVATKLRRHADPNFCRIKTSTSLCAMCSPRSKNPPQENQKNEKTR